MKLIIPGIAVCVAAVGCLAGTSLQAAIFIPTVDGIVYDGQPFGATKDGVPDHFIDNGGALDVFNVTPLEARTVIEFTPGIVSEPITSARLVLRVFATNGPFPIRLDLYAYGADAVISLTDFAAGAWIASVSYSNQTYVMFDVTGVVSEFSTGSVSRIGFNLRVPDPSPALVNGPLVAFYSREADLFGYPAQPAALLINDADGDGIGDPFDQCPDTPFGVTVNEIGCSIEQLCPCEGPWATRHEYVRCVKRTVREFLDSGRITKGEARAFLSQATRSDCGP